MMWNEVADIGSLLHELDASAFHASSLWRGLESPRRPGHMGLGHTTPVPTMLVRLGRDGFNVSKASLHESKTMFDGKRVQTRSLRSGSGSWSAGTRDTAQLAGRSAPGRLLGPARAQPGHPAPSVPAARDAGQQMTLPRATQA
jgi:hypothetical protein